MQYGAKGAMYAPFAEGYTPEAGKAPTYGTVIDLPPLVRVTESPTFNIVKAYGDDHVTGQMSEFKECPLSFEANDLPNTVSAAMLGGKLDDKGGVVWSANDTPSYGGFAFRTHMMLPDQNNKKVWRAFFYPQVQAVMQGRDYSTKGDSVVLANERLTLNAIAAMDENWRYDSPDFDKEADAVAWQKSQLGVPAQAAT